MPRRGASWLAMLLVLGLMAEAMAQRGGGRRPMGYAQNVPYNGRFTFSRVQYGTGGGFGRGWASAWNHDYPDADRHLPLILDALTSMRPNLDGSNIFSLDDPEIFRHPVLYMWEPGFWTMSDAQAASLRAYLQKGGFIIFDDFEADQWYNFEEQFRRAWPDAAFVELDTSHPVFHAFFELDRLNLPHPSVNVRPAYYAVYEDNDPSRRMVALVNYNSDVAEYWEWSATGTFPVNTTNDAYKLGINYFVYAMLH